MNRENRIELNMKFFPARRTYGVWLVIAAWLVAVPTPGGSEEVAGAPAQGSALCSGVKVRVCVMPVLLTGAYGSRPEDLAPLLEAHLAACSHVQVAPVKIVREQQHDVDLLWGKGVWEEGSEQRRAEVYFKNRERWLERAGCLPCDCVILGRVISTGERRTLLAEVFRKGAPAEILFSAVESTHSDGEIPEALLRIARQLCVHLEKGWSSRCMEEIRSQVLGRICSLEAAVREGRGLVEAHPDSLDLRAGLLSLCEESEAEYGRESAEQAKEIVHLLKPGDSGATAIFAQLNLDPFDILCREQADQGDWPGVLETSRLGLEKHPFGARAHKIWQTRALLELGRPKEAMREVDRLLQGRPQDGEAIRLRQEIERRFPLPDLSSGTP